jgi:hypothetical protein
MRIAELLALGYFVAVAGLSLILVRRRPRWWRSLGVAAAGAVVALTAPLAPTVSVLDPAQIDLRLRDWWLLPALALAYWAPAPLVGAPLERLERWLGEVDRRLGVARTDHRAERVLELAYLLVYVMVPAGLLAVIGSGNRSALEVFWPAVLIATLPCYILLPLVPTRPPRALNPAPSAVATTPDVVRQINARFMAIFSNGWNTVPSGHAACATAIAMVVWRSGSLLTPIFLVLAIGIALGAVRGRYHYTVDTVLGVALGTAAGLYA